MLVLSKSLSRRFQNEPVYIESTKTSYGIINMQKDTFQIGYGAGEREMWKAVMVYIKVVLKPPSELRTTPKLSRRAQEEIKKEYVYQKIEKGIVISSQKATIVNSKSPETLSNTILFSRHL